MSFYNSTPPDHGMGHCVLQKDYGSLRTLFGKTGQGLDPKEWTINIVGTEQWEQGVTLNPDLERLKNKAFPHWQDWQEMFGRDRANGEGAVDIGSTVQQILVEEQMEANNYVGGPSNVHINVDGVNEEEADDAMSGADTKEAIADLSRAICSLKEVDPAVNKLYAVMEELPGLTTDECVVAANKIAASQTGVALFFTMRLEAKISFVRNVLRGSI